MSKKYFSCYRNCRALYILAIFLSVFSVSIISASEKNRNDLRIAVSKSLTETGILRELIKRFQIKNSQIHFEIYESGSLQALGYARNGKADLVISHIPSEEQRLVEDGFIEKRTQLLFSKYAVFGPPLDELRLAQKSSVIDVFNTIAEAEVPFLAPSSSGGTYRKIEELWASTGINPEWPDYQYTQLSSPATLKQAAEFNSYALADTMIFLRNKDSLVNKIAPLYQNDLILKNIFSILIVNPKNKTKSNRYTNAVKFYEYLISSEGQEDIHEIGKMIFNDEIIIPAAKFDSTLALLRKDEQLEKEKRSLVIVVILLFILLLATLFIFYSYKKYQNSEKKRLQEEIRYRDLVETTPDWVWELDENFSFTYASPRIVKLLGYFPEDVIGLNFLDLINDNNFFNIINKREPFFNLECSRIHKNGRFVTTEVSAIPVFNEYNNCIGFRGVERDISERKKTENENLRLQKEIQQSHKMQSLGQLTGGVAHDFNNILGAILGFAGLAKKICEKNGDERLINYIRQIDKAGLRAKDLIAQMLAFSRTDYSVDRAMYFAPQIKEEIVMLRSMLPASVEIESFLDDELPPVLLTPTQLQQVLLNLAINARDAMAGQGKLSIRLEWKKHVDATCIASHMHVSGDWISLSVSDTGEGIAEEKINDIFNPFFTTKEVGKGTGLGLSVIYGVMRNHDGHILLQSDAGMGATFSLLFQPSNENDVDLDIATEKQKDIPYGKGQNILIVDDDVAVGEYLGELLKMYEYKVTVVDNAAQALSLLKQNRENFDLLLTDQTMPEMTGIDLIEEVRLFNPVLAVMICSGYSEKVNEKKAEDMDAYYLKKPIDSEQLLIKVADLLK